MRPLVVVFLSLLLHLSTFGDSGKSDTSTALTIRALYKQIEALEKRVAELERYIQTKLLPEEDPFLTESQGSSNDLFKDEWEFVNLQSETSEPVLSAKPVEKNENSKIEGLQERIEELEKNGLSNRLARIENLITEKPALVQKANDENSILNKQARTDFAEGIKTESKLPKELPSGVIWEDAFHADVIDTLIFSYIGIPYREEVTKRTDAIWDASEGAEFKEMGFKDLAILWINEETKQMRGLYSARLERWFETMDEFTESTMSNNAKAAPVLSAKPAAKRGDPTDERNWRKLKRGMTEEQVIGILGEPNHIKVYSFGKYWSYTERKPNTQEYNVEFNRHGGLDGWESTYEESAF